MLVRELRAKTREELLKLLNDLKAELFLLRFRNSTNQLKEVHKIQLVRKDIARVFTVLNTATTTDPKAAPAKKASAKKAPSKKAAKKPTYKKAQQPKPAKAKKEVK